MVNCIILDTVLNNAISLPNISSVIRINDLFGRALGLIFARNSTASDSLPAPHLSTPTRLFHKTFVRVCPCGIFNQEYL